MRQAPDFNLPDQDNNLRSLRDYSGQWLVLYFYPKDDTPGCTKEACAFRDARDLLAKLGNCKVVGISRDTPRSHKKFAEKFNLNFTLLSDPDHGVIEAYGAWAPKKLMGREFLGILRNTYLINPEGKIVQEFLGVDPAQHAAELLEALKTHKASTTL